MNEELRAQINQIEVEDPSLFEELSLKRKWSYVCKDPSKPTKDGQMNKNEYWQQLNHMPTKGVNRIVTDKILKYDKVSCDRILKSILLDKRDEDAKKAFL